MDGGFVLAGESVSFAIGEYDASLPLIIDPAISYSTLLGGSGANAANALAVDSTGAAYIAGFTESTNFPTANPEQNFNAGGNDVFVAKLNPAGAGLVYCTYIGGLGDDQANGIAVDAAGAAYVTGSTTSPDFPVSYPLQAQLAGSKNAFVLKLSAAGNALAYSTYLGGSSSDSGNGIAVDGAGAAYVVGDATSLNFPASGFQTGQSRRAGRFRRQVVRQREPVGIQHLSGRVEYRSRRRDRRGYDGGGLGGRIDLVDRFSGGECHFKALPEAARTHSWPGSPPMGIRCCSGPIWVGAAAFPATRRRRRRSRWTGRGTLISRESRVPRTSPC